VGLSVERLGSRVGVVLLDPRDGAADGPRFSRLLENNVFVGAVVVSSCS
jgi:hypothetical protein